MDYEELKKDCIDYLKEGSNELEPKDVENIKKFVCSFKDVNERELMGNREIITNCRTTNPRKG